jgi:hypothetical protein
MNSNAIAERGSHTVLVAAQNDHLQSVARARPLVALAELVWNALDADASKVKIVIDENKLGSPSFIRIIDDGLGISEKDAQQAFGNLGGSWKRSLQHTVNSSKKIHGRDGKGRFKAFALGHDVEWDTAFSDENRRLKQFTIRGSASNLQRFEIASAIDAPPERNMGTIVEISNLFDSLSGLSSEGSADRELSEVFALYLRNYPTVEIFFRGKKIDPGLVEISHATIELPPIITEEGNTFFCSLDIVEWSFSKKDRRICLCDSNGFMLHDVEAGIRPGAEFNFTAYLRTDFISHLHDMNMLILEELNTLLCNALEDARNELRAYFRRRKAESASELVQGWKEEGVYPFDGIPSNPVDQARREIFDICALNVHENLVSFRDGKEKDRKFTLGMIKTALDGNPEALRRILLDVLELPRDRQSELADLLQHTTLSAIIEASKMVTDRLRILAGLKELLFKPESKRELKERSQLHRILESETWLFGEEYLLTNSDENLTTVLKNHLTKLRPHEKQQKKLKPVQRDDGSQAVIDLLLGREVPAYAKTRREFLVVELKRPSQPINLEVKAQIESYAFAVATDERFDKTNTYWTFLAISNEMTKEAERTVTQQGKACGFFQDEPKLRIGLATWSQILESSRTRLEAFRTKLNYTATTDQGIALLHERYSQYIPKSFHNE